MVISDGVEIYISSPVKSNLRKLSGRFADLEEPFMNCRNISIIMAAMAIVAMPFVAYGQQISPNPNPSGNMISVCNSYEYNDSSLALI